MTLNKEEILLKYGVKPRVVIFDLEATAEDKAIDANFPNEIIEIGAVDNFGNIFNEFIQPKQQPLLTPFIQTLTTITQEDVDNAKGFEEVYPKFYDFFKDATLFSWGAYDKKQLLVDLALNKMTLGEDYIEANHINMKDLYRDITGFRAKGMGRTLKKLNIPLVGTHHRGIDDALNIQKIYNYLMEELNKKG